MPDRSGQGVLGQRAQRRTRRTVGVACAWATAFAAGAPPTAAAPNGLIAFETTGSSRTIATLDQLGRSRKTVPKLPQDSGDPAWSADGHQLAFSSTYLGNPEIYVFRDGAGLHLVTVDAASDVEPAWSPDGRHLAFASSRRGSYDIYVKSLVGNDPPQRLTTDKTDERNPAWSPDGSQIAFDANRNGNHDIWLTTPDGLTTRQLTSDPVDETDATWSPDGAQLAFSAGASGSYELESVDVAAGNRRKLTPQYSSAVSPAWSPDGTQIVFSLNGTLLNIPSGGILSAATAPATPFATGAADPAWAPRVSSPSARPQGATAVPATTVPETSAQSIPKGKEVDGERAAGRRAWRNTRGGCCTRWWR